MKIDIPLIAQTDVLILGGTIEACLLAVQLRRNNLSVYCVTPYSYFGEEVCATLNLDMEKIRAIARFGVTLGNYSPAGIKQALDSMLISAGVEYLYENRPISPMYDEAGDICGRLFAGRSGFFAIAAKTVVNTLPPPPANQGTATLTSISTGMTFQRHERTYQADSITDFSRLELEMRAKSWTPETLRFADECTWNSKSPDLPDADELTARVQQSSPGKQYSFREKSNEYDFNAVSFDIMPRWENCPKIPFELNSLPLESEYDVLVCGAGTGGAPAAIAAARHGARTLCVEKLSIPGGVCTAGRIGAYWFGNCCGFTTEMDRGIGEMAPVENYKLASGRTPKERKNAWLTRELNNSGSEVRFNTFIVGALRRGNQISGAILAGPFGVHLVKAKVAVDASGNADLAAAAGAPTNPLSSTEPAVQGAGLPAYELDKPYFNSDYTFSNDSDVVDATAAFTMAHEKFALNYDVAQILDTRERRRIQGDIELQPMDFFAHRQYHDTVVVARSNFDTHGFVLHPMFLLKPAEHQPYFANVPFRALLPKGWEGVLVTGLGVSAHRDCMPLIRMQPDVQNQGYAAGIAAAMAAKTGTPLRQIAMKELQRHLVECEILPPEILSGDDSSNHFDANNSHLELAQIFMEPEKSVEKVLQDFHASPTAETAALLAFLGNNAGGKVLAEAIASRNWDRGWEYRGMGQFGFSASPLDVLIMAAARIGGADAEVLGKLRILAPAAEFSHFRAVCLYLMAHPLPEAAAELERFLKLPGFTGHALQTLRDVLKGTRGSSTDTTVRNAQLKELYVAKALKACCPISSEATEILKQYRNSMQSCYAPFAE